MFRRFAKDKSSFFINLLGLSSGLTCVLLIFLWIKDEIGMDKFHKNDRRLYQVENNLKSSQGIMTMDITPIPLAGALTSEMPEVEYAVSVNDFWERKVSFPMETRICR